MIAKHKWFTKPLRVMPANNSAAIVHYWTGRNPRRIGWLVGPGAMRKTKLRPWIRFALDNDAFSAWTTGKPWDEVAWRWMLDHVKRSGMTPLWALVPDVVANREATLARWERFAPVVADFGWQLAFALQDGMTPADIPDGADVLFVGGTTEWKWRTLPAWVATGRRVHVGRVNTIEKVHACERLGVESVDGTGWFRDSEDGAKVRALDAWLSGKLQPHPELL